VEAIGQLGKRLVCFAAIVHAGIKIIRFVIIALFFDDDTTHRLL